MKDKTEKQAMVEKLVKFLSDDVKAEDVLYAMAFLENERARKRKQHKPSGRPIGRPRKLAIPVENNNSV
jgi:hypothetical protein